MDTAVRGANHAAESIEDADGASAHGSSPALTVTATYGLSEAGRKASLLAGGDGRATQQITVHVPANRLHLVAVDEKGAARLKLRPLYQLNDRREVVRIDSWPAYDNPPAVEDLFRAAAQNYEMERTYETERTAARSRRQEAQRELKVQLAQSFLNDHAQRAIVHPAPTPKRCYLVAPDGRRLLFDVDTDQSVARELPPEAHRRFRADLTARAERNRLERAAQLAVHEEKKRFIADWIREYGTPEQQTRQAAGFLPMDEAVEAITVQAFAVVGDRPLYARDGAARLQAHLRQLPQYPSIVVAPDDLAISSSNAVKATTAQWALVQELQAAVPDATVTLRVHTLTCKKEPNSPALTLSGVLVTFKFGPFTLRREYAAPG